MASVHGSNPSGAAQESLDPAWQMRWRAPELALVLSDRAVAQARADGDRSLRLRAEALALFASQRLGRGVSATHRAIAAFRGAESSADHEMVARLSVELAGCAREASSHDVSLRVLSPILEQERIDPVVRAHALVELAAALPPRRKESESAEALDEADRLYLASDVNRETGRLLRARVSAARAAHWRRSGDFTAAVQAADDGLALLAGLGDPGADSGEINAHLVLERVHALLERGQRAEAVEAARSIIGQPVRAASAGPAGWLRLALATRVHLPEGDHDLAIWLLNDAAADADRYKLDHLLAETLSSTSHAYERAEDVVAALKSLRGAYAAERRWRVAVHSARLRLLEEFPALSRGVAVSRDIAAPRSEPFSSTAPTSREVSGSRQAAVAHAMAVGHESAAVDDPAGFQESGAFHEPVSYEPASYEPTSYEPASHESVGPQEFVGSSESVGSYGSATSHESGGPAPFYFGGADSTPGAAATFAEPVSSAGTASSYDPVAAEETPAPREPESPRGRRHRSDDAGEETTAEAARRLMETLTAMSADRRQSDQFGTAERTTSSGRRAMPEPRLSESPRHEPSYAEHDSSDAQPPEGVGKFPMYGYSSDPPSSEPIDESDLSETLSEYAEGASEFADEDWPTSHTRPDAGAHAHADVDSDRFRAPEPRESAPVVEPDVPLDTWEAWDQPLPARSGGPEARPEAPDVTTIMPVIAVPPADEPVEPLAEPSSRRHAEPEPPSASWSDEDSASTDRSLKFPFLAQQRSEYEHPVPETEAHEPRSSGRASWQEASWERSASYDAPYDPPVFEPSRRTPTHETPTPEPDERPAPFDAPPDPDQEGGRRAKGRSLAEIRASLRVVQDSGRWGPSTQSVPASPEEASTGRRHARHADPDDEPEPASGGEPAGDLLARHGQWPQETQMPPPVAHQTERVPDPEPPAEVGLADLLAEALMAYENGRHDEAEAEQATVEPEPGGRRRAGSNPPGGTGQSHAPRPEMSTSDSEVGPARHRAGMESGGIQPQSWNPYGN